MDNSSSQRQENDRGNATEPREMAEDFSWYDTLMQADNIVVEDVREAAPSPLKEVTLRKRYALQDFDAHWAVADDDGRRASLREDLRAVILGLARDAEVSDAYVREGLGCLARLRAVCGPRAASVLQPAARVAAMA